MPHNTPACSQAFSQLRADLPELFSEFSREVSCEVFKKYAVKKTLMGPPGPLRAPHRSPPIPRPPPPPGPLGPLPQAPKPCPTSSTARTPDFWTCWSSACAGTPLSASPRTWPCSTTGCRTARPRAAAAPPSAVAAAAPSRPALAPTAACWISKSRCPMLRRCAQPTSQPSIMIF